MRFSIRGRIGDFDLEIIFDSEEEFGGAVQSFARLRNVHRVTKAKSESLRLWTVEGDSKRVSAGVEDSIHRIAVCLLETYPKAKSSSGIALEVGLSGSTVSNYLAGRFTEKGYLFQKIGEGWSLSDDGIEETVSTIVPMYGPHPKSEEGA